MSAQVEDHDGRRSLVVGMRELVLEELGRREEQRAVGVQRDHRLGTQRRLDVVL